MVYYCTKVMVMACRFLGTTTRERTLDVEGIIDVLQSNKASAVNT